MKNSDFKWENYSISTKGYDIGVVDDDSDVFVGMGMLVPDPDFPDQFMLKIRMDEDFLKSVRKNKKK